MSDAKVEFTPEALREIDDAFEWYLERSLQVAEAFVQEVDRAVALIASSPTIWPYIAEEEPGTSTAPHLARTKATQLAMTNGVAGTTGLDLCERPLDLVYSSSVNRSVRTRMLGGVGGGGENPPPTRFDGLRDT